LHQNKYQTALKKKKTKFNIILILISTHAIKQILSEEPKPTGKLQKKKKKKRDGNEKLEEEESSLLEKLKV
jgi:hypothetical protein